MDASQDKAIEARFRNHTDQVNWDTALIERMSQDKFTKELIPFNLGKAVLQRDPASNVSLKAGDVVTILSHKDLAVPIEKQSRLVRIEGEVAAPGIYNALPGETLPQIVKRIGGLSAQAYVYGSEFNRESVRLRQQENLDNLIRRLESTVQGRTKTGNASGQDAAAVAILMQQEQTQIQAQINKLKSLKSSGRLALEMDPMATSIAGLPNLPLEDGDRFFVPPVPGYVAAAGAVYNENAVIYRPGKTVGDVVRAAGLTDEAEAGSAFVLRADGSVVAKRDRGSLFGSGFESMAVMPGDTLVVPAKVDREDGYSFTVRAMKDWTQIFSNLGIGAAAIKSLRN